MVVGHHTSNISSSSAGSAGATTTAKNNNNNNNNSNSSSDGCGDPTTNAALPPNSASFAPTTTAKSSPQSSSFASKQRQHASHQSRQHQSKPSTSSVIGSERNGARNTPASAKSSRSSSVGVEGRARIYAPGGNISGTTAASNGVRGATNGSGRTSSSAMIRRESRHLHVEGLPHSANSERITSYFSQYGRVHQISQLNVEIGTAVVSFMDVRSAQKAHFSGSKFDGRPLRIQFYDLAATPMTGATQTTIVSLAAASTAPTPFIHSESSIFAVSGGESSGELSDSPAKLARPSSAMSSSTSSASRYLTNSFVNERRIAEKKEKRRNLVTQSDFQCSTSGQKASTSTIADDLEIEPERSASAPSISQTKLNTAYDKFASLLKPSQISSESEVRPMSRRVDSNAKSRSSIRHNSSKERNVELRKSGIASTSTATESSGLMGIYVTNLLSFTQLPERDQRELLTRVVVKPTKVIDIRFEIEESVNRALVLLQRVTNVDALLDDFNRCQQLRGKERLVSTVADHVAVIEAHNNYLAETCAAVTGIPLSHTAASGSKIPQKSSTTYKVKCKNLSTAASPSPKFASMVMCKTFKIEPIDDLTTTKMPSNNASENQDSTSATYSAASSIEPSSEATSRSITTTTLSAVASSMISGLRESASSTTGSAISNASPQHKNASRTLFVGGLERNVTDEYLLKRFGVYGHILDVDVKNREAPAPFAFIQYTNINSVVAAITACHTANRTPNSSSEDNIHKPVKTNWGKSICSNKLWIDGLPASCSHEYLSSKLRVITPDDNMSELIYDSSACEAIVIFKTNDAAQAALHKIKNHVVTFAPEKLGEESNHVQTDFCSEKLHNYFVDRKFGRIATSTTMAAKNELSISSSTLIPPPDPPKSLSTASLGNCLATGDANLSTSADNANNIIPPDPAMSTSERLRIKDGDYSRSTSSSLRRGITEHSTSSRHHSFTSSSGHRSDRYGDRLCHSERDRDRERRSTSRSHAFAKRDHCNSSQQTRRATGSEAVTPNDTVDALAPRLTGRGRRNHSSPLSSRSASPSGSGASVSYTSDSGASSIAAAGTSDADESRYHGSRDSTKRQRERERNRHLSLSSRQRPVVSSHEKRRSARRRRRHRARNERDDEHRSRNRSGSLTSSMLNVNGTSCRIPRMRDKLPSGELNRRSADLSSKERLEKLETNSSQKAQLLTSSVVQAVPTFKNSFESVGEIGSSLAPDVFSTTAPTTRSVDHEVASSKNADFATQASTPVATNSNVLKPRSSLEMRLLHLYGGRRVASSISTNSTNITASNNDVSSKAYVKNTPASTDKVIHTPKTSATCKTLISNNGSSRPMNSISSSSGSQQRLQTQNSTSQRPLQKVMTTIPLAASTKASGLRDPRLTGNKFKRSSTSNALQLPRFASFFHLSKNRRATMTNAETKAGTTNFNDAKSALPADEITSTPTSATPKSTSVAAPKTPISNSSVFQFDKRDEQCAQVTKSIHNDSIESLHDVLSPTKGPTPLANTKPDQEIDEIATDSISNNMASCGTNSEKHDRRMNKTAKTNAKASRIKHNSVDADSDHDSLALDSSSSYIKTDDESDAHDDVALTNCTAARSLTADMLDAARTFQAAASAPSSLAQRISKLRNKLNTAQENIRKIKLNGNVNAAGAIGTRRMTSIEEELQRLRAKENFAAEISAATAAAIAAASVTSIGSTTTVASTTTTSASDVKLNTVTMSKRSVSMHTTSAVATVVETDATLTASSVKLELQIKQQEPNESRSVDVDTALTKQEPDEINQNINAKAMPSDPLNTVAPVVSSASTADDTVKVAQTTCTDADSKTQLYVITASTATQKPTVTSSAISPSVGSVLTTSTTPTASIDASPTLMATTWKYASPTVSAHAFTAKDNRVNHRTLDDLFRQQANDSKRITANKPHDKTGRRDNVVTQSAETLTNKLIRDEDRSKDKIKIDQTLFQSTSILPGSVSTPKETHRKISSDAGSSILSTTHVEKSSVQLSTPTATSAIVNTLKSATPSTTSGVAKTHLSISSETNQHHDVGQASTFSSGKPTTVCNVKSPTLQSLVANQLDIQIRKEHKEHAMPRKDSAMPNSSKSEHHVSKEKKKSKEKDVLLDKIKNKKTNNEKGRDIIKKQDKLKTLHSSKKIPGRDRQDKKQQEPDKKEKRKIEKEAKRSAAKKKRRAPSSSDSDSAEESDPSAISDSDADDFDVGSGLKGIDLEEQKRIMKQIKSGNFGMSMYDRVKRRSGVQIKSGPTSEEKKSQALEKLREKNKKKINRVQLSSSSSRSGSSSDKSDTEQNSKKRAKETKVSEDSDTTASTLSKAKTSAAATPRSGSMKKQKTMKREGEKFKAKKVKRKEVACSGSENSTASEDEDKVDNVKKPNMLNSEADTNKELLKPLLKSTNVNKKKQRLDVTDSEDDEDYDTLKKSQDVSKKSIKSEKRSKTLIKIDREKATNQEKSKMKKSKPIVNDDDEDTMSKKSQPKDEKNKHSAKEVEKSAKKIVEKMTSKIEKVGKSATEKTSLASVKSSAAQKLEHAATTKSISHNVEAVEKKAVKEEPAKQKHSTTAGVKDRSESDITKSEITIEKTRPAEDMEQKRMLSESSSSLLVVEQAPSVTSTSVTPITTAITPTLASMIIKHSDESSSSSESSDSEESNATSTDGESYMKILRKELSKCRSSTVSESSDASVDEQKRSTSRILPEQPLQFSKLKQLQPPQSMKKTPVKQRFSKKNSSKSVQISINDSSDENADASSSTSFAQTLQQDKVDESMKKDKKNDEETLKDNKTSADENEKPSKSVAKTYVIQTAEVSATESDMSPKKRKKKTSTPTSSSTFELNPPKKKKAFVDPEFSSTRPPVAVFLIEAKKRSATNEHDLDAKRGKFDNAENKETTIASNFDTAITTTTLVENLKMDTAIHVEDIAKVQNKMEKKPNDSSQQQTEAQQLSSSQPHHGRFQQQNKMEDQTTAEIAPEKKPLPAKVKSNGSSSTSSSSSGSGDSTSSSSDDDDEMKCSSSAFLKTGSQPPPAKAEVLSSSKSSTGFFMQKSAVAQSLAFLEEHSRLYIPPNDKPNSASMVLNAGRSSTSFFSDVKSSLAKSFVKSADLSTTPTTTSPSNDKSFSANIPHIDNSNTAPKTTSDQSTSNTVVTAINSLHSKASLESTLEVNMMAKEMGQLSDQLDKGVMNELKLTNSESTGETKLFKIATTTTTMTSTTSTQPLATGYKKCNAQTNKRQGRLLKGASAAASAAANERKNIARNDEEDEARIEAELLQRMREEEEAAALLLGTAFGTTSQNITTGRKAATSTIKEENELMTDVKETAKKMLLADDKTTDRAIKNAAQALSSPIQSLINEKTSPIRETQLAGRAAQAEAITEKVTEKEAEEIAEVETTTEKIAEKVSKSATQSYEIKATFLAETAAEIAVTKDSFASNTSASEESGSEMSVNADEKPIVSSTRPSTNNSMGIDNGGGYMEIDAEQLLRQQKKEERREQERRKAEELARTVDAVAAAASVSAYPQHQHIQQVQHIPQPQQQQHINLHSQQMMQSTIMQSQMPQHQTQMNSHQATMGTTYQQQMTPKTAVATPASVHSVASVNSAQSPYLQQQQQSQQQQQRTASGVVTPQQQTQSMHIVGDTGLQKQQSYIPVPTTGNVVIASAQTQPQYVPQNMGTHVILQSAPNQPLQQQQPQTAVLLKLSHQQQQQNLQHQIQPQQQPQAAPVMNVVQQLQQHQQLYNSGNVSGVTTGAKPVAGVSKPNAIQHGYVQQQQQKYVLTQAAAAPNNTTMAPQTSNMTISGQTIVYQQPPQQQVQQQQVHQQQQPIKTVLVQQQPQQQNVVQFSSQSQSQQPQQHHRYVQQVPSAYQQRQQYQQQSQPVAMSRQSTVVPGSTVVPCSVASVAQPINQQHIIYQTPQQQQPQSIQQQRAAIGRQQQTYSVHVQQSQQQQATVVSYQQPQHQQAVYTQNQIGVVTDDHKLQQYQQPQQHVSSAVHANYVTQQQQSGAVNPAMVSAQVYQPGQVSVNAETHAAQQRQQHLQQQQIQDQQRLQKLEKQKQQQQQEQQKLLEKKRTDKLEQQKLEQQRLQIQKEQMEKQRIATQQQQQQQQQQRKTSTSQQSQQKQPYQQLLASQQQIPLSDHQQQQRLDGAGTPFAHLLQNFNPEQMNAVFGNYSAGNQKVQTIQQQLQSQQQAASVQQTQMHQIQKLARPQSVMPQSTTSHHQQQSQQHAAAVTAAQLQRPQSNLPADFATTTAAATGSSNSAMNAEQLLALYNRFNLMNNPLVQQNAAALYARTLATPSASQSLTGNWPSVTTATTTAAAQQASMHSVSSQQQQMASMSSLPQTQLVTGGTSGSDLELLRQAIQQQQNVAAKLPQQQQLLTQQQQQNSYLAQQHLQQQSQQHQQQQLQQHSQQLQDKYPILWQGQLAMKATDTLVQLHRVHGNPHFIELTQRELVTRAPGAQAIRITQRMRREPSQLETLMRKMDREETYMSLVGLPCGRNRDDIAVQTNRMKKNFIEYFTEKMAAGIINQGPTQTPPSCVAHVFPPCDFATSHLSRYAPDLLNKIEANNANQCYLFIVITYV